MSSCTENLTQEWAWGAQDGRGNLGGTAGASTGVYVGCVWQEYQVLLEHAHVAPSVAVLTGSGMNFMVGRVSYTFGLQGSHTFTMPFSPAQMRPTTSQPSNLFSKSMPGQ